MSYQKFRRTICSALAFAIVLNSPAVQAYWVWSPETGKFVNPEGAVQDTPDEQYRYAMAIYDEGDRGQAIDELENLLKQYPGAKIAPEVQLQVAIFLEEAQEFKKAFENYKALLKSYPQFERADEVIRREYDLGHIFLSGIKRKIAGLPILPSLPLAAEVFQHIVDTAPFSAYGSQAQFNLGVALKKLGRYEEAIKAFQDLAETYPKSELVSDASFQAAETQLMMSSTVNRDQQGLDEARKQFEVFLADHPHSPALEQAAALKRQAEEKHAQKNYDIAKYYEERAYLDSAIIYFESVAKMYPDSEWGRKATGRLRQLKDPIGYWESEAGRISEELSKAMAELDKLTAKLALLPDDSGTQEERMRLESKRKELEIIVKGLRAGEEEIRKAKKEDISRRRDLLSRKTRELSSKRDALKRKKKKFKHVDSEDLSRAFARWDEALEIEAASLEREKTRLDRLAEDVGVRAQSLWLDLLPFAGGGELSEVITYKKDEIEEIDAQRAFLENRRKDLFDERESIHLEIQMLEMKQLEILSEKEGVREGWLSQDENLKQHRKELEVLRQEIAKLEKEAGTLEERYREIRGFSFGTVWASARPALVQTVPSGRLGAVLKAPVNAVNASVGLLNPLSYFGGEEEITVDKLDAREEHLKEKLMRKEERLREIGSALEREESLKVAGEAEAKAEAEAPEGGVEKIQQADVKTLDRREARRAIRKIERDIRRVYQQVDDHRRMKNHKVDELENLLKAAEKEIVKTSTTITRSVTEPFKGAGRLVYAFVFGLKEKEEFVQKDAGALEPVVKPEMQAGIISLQEEIQFENILIGAKRQELADLERKLFETKELAAAAGAPSFQSLLLEQSYGWLKHTLEFPAKMMPRQEVAEILRERFEKERSERDEIQRELEAIRIKRESLLSAQEPAESSVVAKVEGSEEISAPLAAEKPPVETAPQTAVEEEPFVEPAVTGTSADEAQAAAMDRELGTLLSKIEERRRSLETREQMYRKEIKSFYDAGLDEKLKQQFSRGEAALFTRDKDLDKKLKAVEKDLTRTINDERGLIQEERKLLLERLERITELTKEPERVSEKQRKLIQDEADKLNNHLKLLEQSLPRLEDEGKVLMPGRETM
ncbi:MAG: outer membrane protein assembly factor BamD [Candidatus Omnitrophica bacterium]|nr:outer membrane protein assembly factor BamD [Candidatus Omnitrophota bacterium]